MYLCALSQLAHSRCRQVSHLATALSLVVQLVQRSGGGGGGGVPSAEGDGGPIGGVSGGLLVLVGEVGEVGDVGKGGRAEWVRSRGRAATFRLPTLVS